MGTVVDIEDPPSVGGRRGCLYQCRLTVIQEHGAIHGACLCADPQYKRRDAQGV